MKGPEHMNYLEQLEMRKDEYRQRWEGIIQSIYKKVATTEQMDQPSLESMIRTIERSSLERHRQLEHQSDLVFISGGNGVGKDTLSRESTTHYPFVKALNINTRAIRPGEIDGVDSYFWSREAFDRALADDQLIWYDLEHHGHPQGLARQELLTKAQGKKTALLDARVRTVAQLRSDQTLQHLNTLSVYILPPSFDEWYRRLTTRSQASPHENVIERVEISLEEMALAAETCDSFIINDEIPRATALIGAYSKSDNHQ